MHSLKRSETSKYHSSGPKTLSSSKHYPYLISPFDETTEKHIFLPQQGPYLPNRPNWKRAWDSVTRVYGSTVKNVTLTFGLKFFSWLSNMYRDSQKKLGGKPLNIMGDWYQVERKLTLKPPVVEILIFTEKNRCFKFTTTLTYDYNTLKIRGASL